MMTGITWRLPGFYTGIDAEKCYAEIQSIGETATAVQIVDLARDETSELHKCFEWDDTEAAEKYRQYQARQVVHSLVFVESEETKEPTNIRVMQIADVPHTYKPTKLIMQNKDEYAALLDRAIGELKAFQKKYETISELHEVFNAIDAL